jgi:hypothetical protein
MLNITTTEVHLPRQIGGALKSTFDGELEFDSDEDRNFLRIGWHRDEAFSNPPVNRQHRYPHQTARVGRRLFVLAENSFVH